MILSLVCAIGAAFLYGAGTVLQAVGLRRAAGTVAGTRWSRLWAARLYGVGLGLDGLGFLASIVALRDLPLFVVESVIASSVAVTAVLAVLFLGVRLSGAEVAALAAVAAGLVLLALGGAEGPGVALEPWSAWLLLALVAPVLALGLLASRLRDSSGPPLLAVTAGLGFAGVGVAARVLAIPQEWWRLLLDPVPWALLLYAVTALVAFGLALHKGSVTTTTAITFAVETVIPAIIGLAWLGDRVRPGMEAAALLGFCLTLGGSILLGRRSPDHAEGTPSTPSRTGPV
jgi:drug/metabolite transporter (DMT)-like permease